MLAFACCTFTQVGPACLRAEVDYAAFAHCAFTHSWAPRLAFAKKKGSALFTGVKKIGRRFILWSTKTVRSAACWHHAAQKEEEEN
jgi:hypothetical protein